MITHITTIQQCIGCKKITERGCCMVHMNPTAQWSDGRVCQTATHMKNTADDRPLTIETIQRFVKHLEKRLSR